MESATCGLRRPVACGLVVSDTRRSASFFLLGGFCMNYIALGENRAWVAYSPETELEGGRLGGVQIDSRAPPSPAYMHRLGRRICPGKNTE